MLAVHNVVMLWILEPDTPGGRKASMDWRKCSSSATADDMVEVVEKRKKKKSRGGKEESWKTTKSSFWLRRASESRPKSRRSQIPRLLSKCRRESEWRKVKSSLFLFWFFFFFFSLSLSLSLSSLGLLGWVFGSTSLPVLRIWTRLGWK